MVGYAEVAVRQRLQDDLPAGRGERQGALAGGNGLVIRTPVSEKWTDRKRKTCPSRRGSSSASARASASRSIRQDTPKVARRPERRAQGEPQVDGLLMCIARLRQMRQGAERLLEGLHGLAVG